MTRTERITRLYSLGIIADDITAYELANCGRYSHDPRTDRRPDHGPHQTGHEG